MSMSVVDHIAAWLAQSVEHETQGRGFRVSHLGKGEGGCENLEYSTANLATSSSNSNKLLS